MASFSSSYVQCMMLYSTVCMVKWATSQFILFLSSFHYILTRLSVGDLSLSLFFAALWRRREKLERVIMARPIKIRKIFLKAIKLHTYYFTIVCSIFKHSYLHFNYKNKFRNFEILFNFLCECTACPSAIFGRATYKKDGLASTLSVFSYYLKCWIRCRKKTDRQTHTKIVGCVHPTTATATNMGRILVQMDICPI